MTTPTPKISLLKAEKARRLAQTQKERWRLDPVAFADEALGVTLWEPNQAEIAMDVAFYVQTSVRTCQKVGKTDLVAVLALWWVYTRGPGALAILSSGNATQVKQQIWKALTRIYYAAKIPLGGTLHLDPATGLTYPDGRAILGITASKDTNFQGYSGHELFVAIDEASGSDDQFIEAAIGNLGGALPDDPEDIEEDEDGNIIEKEDDFHTPDGSGGRILLTGNPNNTTGFFASTHREKKPGWQLHHISAFQSPNTIAGKTVVRGLAGKRWIRMMARNFGEDSPAYAVRVLGEFPGQQEDRVVALATLDAAKARWTKLPKEEVGRLNPSAPLCIGVDPAGSGNNGDESVIQGVCGKYAYKALAFRGEQTDVVAKKAIEYALERQLPGQQVIIRVDVGGLGQGVADTLETQGMPPGFTYERINSANASRFDDMLVNTRAQLWLGMGQWLKRGGCLPADTRQEAELLACRKTEGTKNRVGVNSKKEMRKLLTPKRSPDRADALCLATFGEHPLGEAGYRGPSEPVQQPKSAPRPHEGARVQSLSDIERPKFQWRPGMGRLPSKSGL